MVDSDVLDGRFRILHLMFLLHRLRHRVEFLAHQPLRGCNHQYFLCHPIRHEKKRIWCRSVSHSAYTVMLIPTRPRLAPTVDDQDDGWAIVEGRQALKKNWAKIVYEYTKWCWVFLALTSLVLQATRTIELGNMHELLIDTGELIITIAFDVELILRVIATLPDWRQFFYHGNNWLDLTLAIGSSVIQIPAIHRSSVYRWFTIFQLARFYRVILEVPRMRPLLV